MARFTRQINKQNRTVTVTDKMTGESVTGRYHDSLSADKAAALIEGDLVQKEAKPRIPDEASGAMQTRQLQDQSGANKMSQEGFLAKQRLLNATKTQPEGESALSRASQGVSAVNNNDPGIMNIPDMPKQDAQMSTNMAMQKSRDQIPEPEQGPVPGTALKRSNSGPDTPNPGNQRLPSMEELKRRAVLANQAAKEQKENQRQKEVSALLAEADNRESLEKALAAEQGRGSYEDVLKPKNQTTGLMEETLMRTDSASPVLEEELMSDTSPKLMEEMTISGDDPTNWLTEDIVQTSGQAAQADIDAELEKIAGTSYLEEMEMGRSTPAYRSIEEQTISADDPPEVKEAKQLQIKASKGDKEAKAEQKKMYSQFKDPEVRAQVKEEFGDYYIDPISGRPINLVELKKSPKRQRDMKMIAMLPEHLRGAALGNMGYLDPEDIPKDYKHDLAKEELAFKMTKWKAEHDTGQKQFDRTFKFKEKTQKDLEKRLGRKLTLEELKESNLSADRDAKQLWDNIGMLIKEGNSPAAGLLAKGAGFKLDFNANTAIQTEILENVSDAKAAGIGHPSGKEGVKSYLKFANNLHVKLMTPRGDNQTGDTFFDTAARNAGIPTFEDAQADGLIDKNMREYQYNASVYSAVFAHAMKESPHDQYHRSVTDQKIRSAIGGKGGDSKGGKGGDSGPNKTDNTGSGSPGPKDTSSFEEEGIGGAGRNYNQEFIQDINTKSADEITGFFGIPKTSPLAKGVRGAAKGGQGVLDKIKNNLANEAKKPDSALGAFVRQRLGPLNKLLTLSVTDLKEFLDTPLVQKEIYN